MASVRVQNENGVDYKKEQLNWVMSKRSNVYPINKMLCDLSTIMWKLSLIRLHYKTTRLFKSIDFNNQTLC